MKKRRVGIPWPSVWLLLTAAIEACFQKWLAVKIMLIICAILTPIWLLIAYLAEKRSAPRPMQPPAGPLGELWRGDWIRTQDRKKKKLLLLLARLSLPTAFFIFAACLVFRNGPAGLETVLIFCSWGVTCLGAMATEIIRDYRDEQREKAAAGDPNKEKRLQQMDEWLESGLIDRAEYQAMIERCEDEQ